MNPTTAVGVVEDAIRQLEKCEATSNVATPPFLEGQLRRVKWMLLQLTKDGCNYAGIMSDRLEEKGFGEAAALLRKEFGS